MLYGQSRIFYIIAQDGLLPKALLKLHPRYGTPYITNILVCVVAMCLAGLVPIEMIADLISLGTLIAFFIVPIIALVLRKKAPSAERPFKCPLIWLVAPTAIITSLIFIYTLIERNLAAFLIWTALGIAIYVFYGRKHSLGKLK